MTIRKGLGRALWLVPLLLLGSCAPGGSLSPSVPVGGPVLSDTCGLAYASYLRERQPVFFAADATGYACGYAICTHRRCVNGFPGDAVRACERVSGAPTASSTPKAGPRAGEGRRRSPMRRRPSSI